MFLPVSVSLSPLCAHLVFKAVLIQPPSFVVFFFQYQVIAFNEVCISALCLCKNVIDQFYIINFEKYGKGIGKRSNH